MGEVSLLDSNGGYAHSITGRYYSKNEKKAIICKNCDSEKELIVKTSNIIKNYFEKQVALSEEVIDKEREKIRKLELILEKMKGLKNPAEVEKWLKQYQTDNPLQLEYQDAARQTGDKK